MKIMLRYVAQVVFAVLVVVIIFGAVIVVVYNMARESLLRWLLEEARGPTG